MKPKLRQQTSPSHRRSKPVIPASPEGVARALFRVADRKLAAKLQNKQARAAKR